METLDLAAIGLRKLNATLQAVPSGVNQAFEVINPRGSHAIAAGLNAPVTVSVKGSTGYYCGGMNQLATVHVQG